MIKIKEMKEFIIGCILIAISGLIYTIERFMAIILWIGQYAPVKINGSGSYSSKPSMPTIFDNLFVPLLLIVGICLIIMSFFNNEN